MTVAATEDDDQIAATAQMCTYCFDVLIRKLHPSSPSPDEANQATQYTPPNIKLPLFVTWEKCQSPPPPPLLSKVSSSSGIATSASSSIITDDETSTHHNNNDTDDNNHNSSPTHHAYELRGCIGTLAPRNLQHALSEFAITSALHDRRFDPISLHELPLLRVGVSLLVNYEECQNCLDWVVGVHGIIIKFDGDPTKRGMEQQQQYQYSATFLPEVASEQSWDQKEAILSLVRKAGYRGSITNELLSRIHCTRYQSSKCRVSYQEYTAKCCGGVDPLSGSSSAELMAAVAVAEEVERRRRVRSSNTCVNL